MACDLAEVIGTAIALNLLLGIPIPFGIVMTGLDVLLILIAWDKKHFKAFEIATVIRILINTQMVTVFSVSACFIVLVFKANPGKTLVFT
jgi:manganese transport protein